MFWKKGGEIAIGVILLLFFGAAFFFDLPLFYRLIRSLERINYGLNLRYSHATLSKDSPVVIVDIDDASLFTEGRWPWSRKKLAELTRELHKAGAKVLVFDLIFSEPEENRATAVLSALEKLPNLESDVIQEVERVEGKFDYDKQFAEALSLGTSLVGFAFQQEGEKQGLLKEPLFRLTQEEEKELFIVQESSYIASIPILQNAAKGEGFINAEVDPDGVVRYAYGLLCKKEGVYPFLPLEAVRLFEGGESARLLVGSYDGSPVLKGVAWGKTVVPLDPWGRLLIPYRGTPYTVPHISAKDVLGKKIEPGQLAGKMVFIGSSATALGDLVATPLAPVFSAVEVLAQIASGILDGYLPYEPVWARRISTWSAFGLGLFAALVFPFLGPIVSNLLMVGLGGLLVALNFWLWSSSHLLIPIVFPLFVLFAVYGINEVTGFLFEKRKKEKIKKMFGQYVPTQRVEQIIEGRAEDAFRGETKELTVLFSDVRNFTAMSEKLSAVQVKEWLNAYFTPVTKTIFEHKGTIDKYIGDMVMAFWGAPLEDSDHGLHALEAAFGILRDLERFNQKLKERGMPSAQIGIGINTGVMNVGDMGSAFRQAYTVLGDEVNIASRLEHETKRFGVPLLVGENTYQKTKEKVVYKIVDKVRLRGREKGLLIYQPMGMQGEISKTLVEEAKMHERALQLYWEQDWDKAKQLFEQLLDREPSLARLFLERIEMFRKTPPPSYWDGLTDS